MADAASIRETNRVRVALGMKPLPVPDDNTGPSFKDSDSSSSEEEEEASTLESRQAEGYGNWKKLEDDAKAKKKRDERKDAVKKAADQAKRFSKLEGKGLGEEDDETEMDTKTWLLQQKKRQKKLEKKREKTKKLEEEMLAREQREYTAKDLAGVKVAHEMGAFGDEGDQILVLKDTTIDENEEEGDELENIDLKEQEKLGEKLELKKKKPVYNPNDWDEDGEKVLLKQYDEVIDGKKRKRFTLDAAGTNTEELEAVEQATGIKARAKPQSISLDILKDSPTSDYKDQGDIKIRKPRKKKAKTMRQKDFDDDIVFPPEMEDSKPDTEAMEIDSGAAGPLQRRFNNASLIDDDDLQASLAKQRRAALKKQKRLKPEDIARQIREKAKETPEVDMEADDGGLVIDETSEFVSRLQKPEEEEKKDRSTAVKQNGSPQPATVEPEDSDSDVDMDDVKQGTSTPPPPQQDITETGLDEEANVGTGLAATFKLVKERGMIDKSEADANTFLQRQRFMLERHRREAAAETKARSQRERDRQSGALERMSARDREEYARRENKLRDQAESKQMTEIFNREYKPEVNLRYFDDNGREMNQKEAFKNLSHQFHGKGSGKMKTEKRIKKIQAEQEGIAKSGLDAGQSDRGLNNAASSILKRDKTFGVRMG